MTSTLPGPLTADHGPAPEPVVVRDLLRRGLPALPVIVAAAGLIRGVDGALSAAFAVALVSVNFVAAAASLVWAARINYAVLMATAMFGYLLRLAAIFGIVFAVRSADWVDMPALGVTLVVTHLGLLFAELRYVSASLAFPALKPTQTSKEHAR